ncbi:23S rRNA (pseudouridine(1915)-N(3))-methyltransferase RlmH [Adlercreutzia sp. ZJ304]|uniref:23S rRNA (pseudouridine(1915)-N(3))-methyltransferase RlmH n=1 Tax=Adlercreutzia sp. ZJ304 TaxID=2709791 RepID=UPI003216A18A
MMRISVVAVGKLKERFWSQACDEYLKRLRPYANVSVLEVPDVDSSQCGVQQALSRESDAVLRVIPEDAFVILLAIRAKEFSSEQLAAKLDKLALEGRSNVVFVIGGSHGVDSTVIARANAQMSFGPITLPHNLARVVLLEQVYRAFKISRGEPYHK